MIWIIGILTLILVLTSILLILLILVQLPKKEAGLGMAFGGGATDALFGAGSGNVLTKMTKWSAVTFFVLTMALSVLNAKLARSKDIQLDRDMQVLDLQETEDNLNAPAVNVPSTNTAAPANPLLTPETAVPATPTPAPAAPVEPAPAVPAPATPAPTDSPDAN